MKKSHYFLLLFIFSFLSSCQNDEELAEIEKSQNELLSVLKSEIGDIAENDIYLLPSSLDNEEFLFRLMMWTDIGTNENNKLLVLGEINNKTLLQVMDAINYEMGSVYQSNNGYKSVQSFEKIQIRDGAIASRKTLEAFELE